MDTNLEKRMYSLVMYNISPIQAGIQSGHSNDEYANHYGDDEEYLDWRSKWRTVILLNGGTSNSGKESYYGYPSAKGSMERHLDTLNEMGVKVVPFYEPDMNYCLTSMSFIVDERIFDRETYPDFKFEEYNLFPIRNFKQIDILLREDYFDEGFPSAKTEFEKWCLSIGGMQNFMLRLFIKQFNLANN